MVESIVERDGRTSTARRFYLSSAALDVTTFARAVRAHWGIENRLHWILDVVFHDDLMRLRTGAGPANVATIRHAALNLIKAIPDRASLKVRRKTLGWDDNYLHAALTAQSPSSSSDCPAPRNDALLFLKGVTIIPRESDLAACFLGCTVCWLQSVGQKLIGSAAQQAGDREGLRGPLFYPALPAAGPP